MKFFGFLLCLPLSLGALAVEAPTAILIDAETGHVLFEKEAHVPRFPASITKVLTGLMVLEAKGDNLQEVAVVPADAVAAISTDEKRRRKFRTPSHWLETGASHIGIKPGEQLTVEALLYGLMLSSGNDAANTLAHHIAGSVPTFVDWMNFRAKQLGCEMTHFTNPHGLHHPEHVTSAYDMALIARAAMREAKFREVVSTLVYDKAATNVQGEAQFYQKNRLVKSGKHRYPFATGVKTGFTSDALGTLVAAADNGERQLIAVVMGCDPFTQCYESVSQLFDFAFAEERVEWRLLGAGPQPFTLEVGGKSVSTVTLDEVRGRFFASAVPELDYQVEWHEVELPLLKGEEVGRVCLLCGDGEEVASITLHAAQRVRRSAPIGVVLLCGGGLCFGLILLRVARRR